MYAIRSYYVVFNCTQECLLKSVKVYAQGAGNRTIYLRDSEGGTIYSQEFYVEDGMQTVNLNFSLPSGNGMRLGCSATAGLYRGSTGVITSYSIHYTKLYDFVSNTQNIDCNPEIQFTNTSEASASTVYLWDFGDDTNSNLENPVHAYNSNGIYTVKLFAENEHGEDSVIKTEYISVNFSQLDNVPDYVICEASGSVTAEYGTSGDLLWFNNINDETGFHTGSSYTTPVLNETTTYYIQEVTTGEIYSGGESDNSEGGSYVTDDNYLVFNCIV